MAYGKPSSPAQPGKWYGHSPNRNGQGEWQFLFDHIHGGTATQPEPGVALLARDFAGHFGAGDEGFLAGLLHDLGKYAPTFTDRLSGAGLALDHWTAGAWAGLRHYGSAKVGLAIEGHHIGLQNGSARIFGTRLYTASLAAEKGLQLTEPNDPNADRLLARWRQDLADHGIGCPPTQVIPQFLNDKTDQTSEMLSVRMLFSALVDADSSTRSGILRRERKTIRRAPNRFPSQAPRALARLRSYLLALSQKEGGNPPCRICGGNSATTVSGRRWQTIFFIR
jgi:CRISPR-associated endonuclease Cas3-HD